MIIQVTLLVLAASSVIGSILLWILIRRGNELAFAIEMQLKGLNATYLQGLEVLTMDLDRIKGRLKTLEDEVL